RISLQEGSFFSNRHLPLNQVLQGLWGLLHRFSYESIESYTRSSNNTIRYLARDFYLLMEADLRLNDVQIG
ncbi:hypothetical protein BDC45DRAFT_414030, partial [Circinella umbellata]